ncbi:MAG TPA: FAD-dependent oxidoreductase [Actinomycetota bacterium]|jgi:4-methylaminobutanoate oxidase (formaldehyde-forming)|nr:FAD-dependent oxidoreductase [Actinomycetota bacterium]
MTVPEHLANRHLDSSILGPVTEPPARAQVVIVGGGIIGSSIAYHLTKLGVTDVVVLERVRLTAGTTWHAAGLVSQVRGTHALTELSKINAALYAALPTETGVDTGFRRVGSLTVARTPGRMQELLAGADMHREFDVECRVLEPKQVLDWWPLAQVDDLVGATVTPTDATVNPGEAALSLAKGAHDRGAVFAFGVTVTGFRMQGGAVTGVETDTGAIDAETVVLAGGLWTSELARLAGTSVALYPAEHVWVMTDEVPGAEERFPFLRDLDGYFYVRHHAGHLVVGAFEPKGKPKAPKDIATSGFVEFGEDWDHLAPVLAAARERLPVLHTVGFQHYLRAPESFSPDANLHLGEFPEVRRLFVAAGLNSQGIIYGPGVGKALAEWIVEGHPTMDLTEVDVARTGRWANNRAWLHEKTHETLGRLYAMHWPALQPDFGRGVRRTPFLPQLREAGGAIGEAAGWERAAWFQPGATEEPLWIYDFERPSWFGPVGEEMRATRTGVALFDLSTYAKFLVQGPDAVAGLQRLCTSDVDVAVGRVVYTLLCNEQGGIEMDPTVTRLAEDRFLVLAPTLYQRRTEMLLRSGLPSGATVTDVTSAYATLHIAGPKSRSVLGALTDQELSNAAFPFLSAKEIDVAWAKALALRVSFAGELGWELLVPTEFAADVFEKVVAAGEPHEMRLAGAFAFDALRLERGFRSWGHDMGASDDPYAVGLGFAVRGNKEDFVGKAALAALKQQPRDRELVSVRLDDPAAMLWHGEPVVMGKDRIGYVTSGGYGHHLGAAVGLAWIHGVMSTDPPVSVEVRGTMVSATISREPFYDPKGARLRL